MRIQILIDNKKGINTLEKEHGLYEIGTFNKFKTNVEKSKKDLVELLKKFKNEGKRVVGYGATSKSTTVLNYCNIGPDLIEFISDTTPIKQGKFTPGMHIPVLSYEQFSKNPPDNVLLFAWNHKKEIQAKESNYKGQWITYVPNVHTYR